MHHCFTNVATAFFLKYSISYEKDRVSTDTTDYNLITSTTSFFNSEMSRLFKTMI